jgi:hypothetical protein
MVNVRNGYLVTEGCAHCGGRLSFFSIEQTPPVDSYVDGDHIWKHLGSSQAVKFDLECTKCGKKVNLDSVVGLMLCTNCTTNCNAGALSTLLGREHTWVYVALCANTTHIEGKCVGLEETRALTEYFNSRIKTPGKKVFFVPCSFVPNMDLCQGEIIADVGLTEIY